MKRTLQSVLVCVVMTMCVCMEMEHYEDEEDYVPVHVYRVVDDPAAGAASASDYQTLLRPPAPFSDPDQSESMLYARPDRYGGFKYSRRPQRLVRVNSRPLPKPRPQSRPRPHQPHDFQPFILRIHKYRYSDRR